MQNSSRWFPCRRTRRSVRQSSYRGWNSCCSSPAMLVNRWNYLAPSQTSGTAAWWADIGGTCRSSTKSSPRARIRTTFFWRARSPGLTKRIENAQSTTRHEFGAEFLVVLVSSSPPGGNSDRDDDHENESTQDHIHHRRDLVLHSCRSPVLQERAVVGRWNFHPGRIIFSLVGGLPPRVADVLSSLTETKTCSGYLGCGS